MPTQIADVDEGESNFPHELQHTGRHFKAETLRTSEDCCLGCESNDDLPRYTASGIVAVAALRPTHTFTARYNHSVTELTPVRVMRGLMRHERERERRRGRSNSHQGRTPCCSNIAVTHIKKKSFLTTGAVINS
jgi:hypothetical protein